MATWGIPVSLKGVKGDAGLSVLNGSTAPASSLGADTQTYINTSNGDVYVRANGTWSKTFNLVGPMGLNGVNGSFFAGTGVPDDSVYSGSGAAIYIRANGEVYIYAGNGTWTDTGESLVGPAGQQGSPGLRGTQTYNGSGAPSSTLTSFTPPAAPGDFYYDLGTAGGPYLYLLGS